MQPPKLTRPRPKQSFPPRGVFIRGGLRFHPGPHCLLRWAFATAMTTITTVGFTSPPSADSRAESETAAETVDGQDATERGITEPLAKARKARLEGRFVDAFDYFSTVRRPFGVPLATEAVLLARSADDSLDSDQLDLLYKFADAALTAQPLRPPELSQRMLLRLAVANHFAQSDQVDQAASVTEAAFRDYLDNEGTVPADASTGQWIRLAMRLGWSQLNAGNAESSQQLYHAVITLQRSGFAGVHLPERELALAMLGRGWAAAMQDGRGEEAAEWLSQFVEQFPEHGDAAAAKALQVQCLIKADRIADAADAVVHFLKRWPDSQQSETIVAESMADETLAKHPGVGEAIEQWILVTGTPQRWTLETAIRSLTLAGDQMAAARFDFLLQRLGEGDTTGRHTATILAQLVAAEKNGLAEQVATFFIAEQYDKTQPMAMESSCRWAGRTGRWTLLAMAAETASPPQPNSRRTVHVDRLFAEALTRTGRKATALQWWRFVVDHHQASDFATLIRCAEAAVADGTVADARERLDRVQVATDAGEGGEQAGNAIRRVLLDVLRADLAVRQIEFEQARTRYESVLRSPVATAPLLGRAQWMIGETYFLQRKFSAAIEAYRKVEGMDPSGPYVAAALIQAGKSFEQLGRTRQAGVCYGTLLSRFADSPHAGEARRRMAALPREGGSRSDASPRAKTSRLRR